MKKILKKVALSTGGVALGVAGMLPGMAQAHNAPKVVQTIKPAIKTQAKPEVKNGNLGIDRKASYHFTGGVARNRFHNLQLTNADVRILNAAMLKAGTGKKAADVLMTFMTSDVVPGKTLGWEFGLQVRGNLNDTDDFGSINAILEGGGYHWDGYTPFNINEFQRTLTRAVAMQSAMQIELGCDYEFLAHNSYEVTYTING